MSFIYAQGGHSDICFGVNVCEVAYVLKRGDLKHKFQKFVDFGIHFQGVQTQSEL